MTTASCEMVGLVEARHDGRLGAPEAASLDRHLESCATCRELAVDLARIAELAHGAADAPSLPPLERRRNRLRLLKAAARPNGEHRRAFGAWQVATATLLCGGVAAAAYAASSSPTPIPMARSNAVARGEPLVVATPGTHVRSRPGLVEVDDGVVAVWSRAPIRVRYGESEYTVEGGLVVDGARGRVEHLAVTSGALSMSRGEGPSSLGAGGDWRAPEVASPAPPETAGAAVHVQPAVTFGSARATPPTIPAGVAPPPPPAPPRDAAFTEGVRLIEHGEYGAARERLAAFRQAHPGDARAEDAAFLEIVALDRAGKKDEARAAAQRYLAAYPSGFRAAEAKAIERAESAR